MALGEVGLAFYESTFIEFNHHWSFSFPTGHILRLQVGTLRLQSQLPEGTSARPLTSSLLSCIPGREMGLILGEQRGTLI